MNAQKVIFNAADPDEKWFYRIGGISALAISTAYIIIITLYVLVGARPSSGEAWLTYLAKRTTAWWVIVALSVITDLLFVPVMVSLYHALKRLNRGIVWFGTVLVGFFIVLDMAITWPNYSSLISLSGNYAAATNEVQRAAPTSRPQITHLRW